MALALLLVSCGTMRPALDEGQLADSPPQYSLVLVIHGDGNYAYHDTLGNVLKADLEALAKAQSIAEQSPNAEVFIFHQFERRHVLFLFPRRDGRAYYYRNGRLLAEEPYWRDQGDVRFAPEMRLYERFAATRSAPPLRLFLYFGHEFPEFDGLGYDASHSKRRVTVDDLVEGVRGLAGENSKFDLITLATCFGGTPHTIGALAPYARYIIASPDNLHLSYFDLAPLASLDIGTNEAEVAGLADRFARHAFEQLASEVQTAVSVVVYDVNDAGEFLDSVSSVYESTLTAANVAPPASLERCDCADESSYALPEMSKGLTVLYRAPQFGRAKHKQQHSGWECWRLTDQ